MGFGLRPALLMIDFINAFNDPGVLGGGNVGAAIEGTVDLLAAARRYKLPIVYTRHVYAVDGSDRGLFNIKNPSLNRLHPDNAVTQVVDSLAPRAGEYVLCKHYPSAFFATDLAGWMSVRRVDTALVTGCTTSGCVRATVVDAMGHGFRPIVVTDCVGDRARAPHDANLFDMEQKYADLMPCASVLAALTKIRATEQSEGLTGAHA